ncbi:hypothetical protein ES708_22763 [subsurface metagenome]
MKKLTILLVVIMLVAVLLAGCWVSPELKLDYIEADPEEVTLTEGEICQLTVIAFYDYSGANDVTLDCDYVSNNIEVATVNDEGLITAIDLEGSEKAQKGEATILITYTQHNFWTGMRVETAEVKVTVGY